MSSFNAAWILLEKERHPSTFPHPPSLNQPTNHEPSNKLKMTQIHCDSSTNTTHIPYCTYDISEYMSLIFAVVCHQQKTPRDEKQSSGSECGILQCLPTHVPHIHLHMAVKRSINHLNNAAKVQEVFDYYSSFDIWTRLFQLHPKTKNTVCIIYYTIYLMCTCKYKTCGPVIQS